MSGVHVRADQILRVRRWDDGDLWIQFRPTGADEDVLDAVEQAMDAANEVMAPFDGRSDGYTCCFVGPWRSPVGARAFHMMEDTGGEFEAITDWLEAFAAALGTAGLTGVVEPLPRQDLSVADVLSGAPDRQLASFVAYSLDDPSPSRPFRWNVPTTATQRIVGHVAGSAFDGAETILGGFPMLRVDHGAVPRALAYRLATQDLASATFARRDPPRGIAFHLSANGMTTRIVYDPSRSWQDRLRDCVDAIIALPDITDVGFVETALGWLADWDSIGRGVTDLPGTRPSDFRYQRALLDRYVPDARGVMLVTDAHLEKAEELSDWTIRSLGHGRHLLQAADLAAWYAVPRVAPDVVAKARQDLGAMILTPEDITRHKQA